MRYALISDVHGNLPALDAVLADIAACANAAATYHLGDLVGYGPWPNEVVARLRDRGIAGVAGNYDSTVATGYKHCGCRYEDAHQEALSHASYAWTREHVSPETLACLGALAARIDLRPNGGHVAGPTLTLIHGNHALNTVYVTEDRPSAFLANMGRAIGTRAGDVVAFGHTHVAWHRIVDGVHYVNTGSVGRPKDGDPRAGYVVLDVQSNGVQVEFRRIAYELSQVADAIMASTLPPDFAAYLRSGGRIGAVATGRG
ncbi:MAG TPA: metallophosphoesterase family protein [Gemmatimonadaceae bacterium]|jgi:predicted phosphodiesterase|nr:metallophosphoesterase family protein [Gemmatimonadaceae bacterium]